jgi:phage FluMu protein Com
MTSETRTLIGLDDISGIEIECPKCHLTIFYPLAQLVKISPQCPHCKQLWFDAIPDKIPVESAHPAIESITSITSNLRALLRNDRTDIHAKVRLQIKTDTPKEEK